MTKVLLVEDEVSFIDALTVGLEHEGFELAVARDGDEAQRRFAKQPPDLVLLDVMLPKVNGLDVCRWIRSRATTPVIMLTARTTELDTVLGLEIGADDYIAKPFRMRELIARMHAVLRRGPAEGRLPTADAKLEPITVGPITLDRARHEVRVHDALVALPLKEFDLLELLLGNAGRVVPRTVIMQRVWGEHYVGDTKTLDVHIKRLRAKLEAADPSSKVITTVRGLGYKLEAVSAR